MIQKCIVFTQSLGQVMLNIHTNTSIHAERWQISISIIKSGGPESRSDVSLSEQGGKSLNLFDNTWFESNSEYTHVPHLRKISKKIYVKYYSLNVKEVLFIFI